MKGLYDRQCWRSDSGATRGNGPSLPSVARKRIRYAWKVVPSNAGHYRYGAGYPLVYRNNQFIADRAGDCQIFYAIIDTVNGYADTSVYKTVHVKAKLVIDKPRRDTTFWITPAPLMPQIKCRAHIAGVDSAAQQTLSFNWKIKLKYKNYVLEKQGSRTGIGDWIPNFGADFGGDTVMIDAGVKYGQDSLKAHIIARDSVRVRGQNPLADSAKAYLRRGYEEPDKARQAEVIGQMESNYRQFCTSGDTIGWPIVSRDGGVGMMRITVATPNRNLFWGWKINADAGKSTLADKWASSNSWFDARVRDGWPTPTTDNRLYDTYCRYNGGQYYSNPPLDPTEACPPCYHRNHIWADSCGVCNPNQPQFDRRVTDNSCRQSGCCYSDDAMEIH